VSRAISVEQPVGDLRERKRLAAMRAIQKAALDLFDRRGFDEVTIEEIAARAVVSPRSVYRYFGTKEGILVQDEYEEPLMTASLELLRDHDIYEAARVALTTIGEQHFHQDADLTNRRARYFIDVPAVKANIYLRMDLAVDRLAEALAAPDHQPPREPLEARVVAKSVVWGLFAAVEEVIRGRTTHPFEVVLERAIEALRPTTAVNADGTPERRAVQEERPAVQEG